MIKLRKIDDHSFTITVPEDFTHPQFETFSAIEGLTVDQIKELVGNPNLTGFQLQDDGTYIADDSAMARIKEYQERKEG